MVEACWTNLENCFANKIPFETNDPFLTERDSSLSSTNCKPYPGAQNPFPGFPTIQDSKNRKRNSQNLAASNQGAQNAQLQNPTPSYKNDLKRNHSRESLEVSRYYKMAKEPKTRVNQSKSLRVESKEDCRHFYSTADVELLENKIYHILMDDSISQTEKDILRGLSLSVPKEKVNYITKSANTSVNVENCKRQKPFSEQKSNENTPNGLIQRVYKNSRTSLDIKNERLEKSSMDTTDFNDSQKNPINEKDSFLDNLNNVSPGIKLLDTRRQQKSTKTKDRYFRPLGRSEQIKSLDWTSTMIPNTENKEQGLVRKNLNKIRTTTSLKQLCRGANAQRMQGNPMTLSLETLKSLENGAHVAYYESSATIEDLGLLENGKICPESNQNSWLNATNLSECQVCLDILRISGGKLCQSTYAEKFFFGRCHHSANCNKRREEPELFPYLKIKEALRMEKRT